MNKTVLLSTNEVTSALDIDEAIRFIRQGFESNLDDLPSAQRIRTDLPGPGTATALIPGLLPDIPAYTVKVNAKFSGASPALRGVVCLFSLEDAELIAILDSASVTAWRTGLAAALGTHTLAPHRSTTVGLIGAGVQRKDNSAWVEDPSLY